MEPKTDTTLDETETIINFSRYMIGEWAELYTSDKNMMRRYEKFASKYPAHCKLVKEDKYSMTFSVDPKCVGITPRKPRNKELSEEQKEEFKQRMANTRTANKI